MPPQTPITVPLNVFAVATVAGQVATNTTTSLTSLTVTLKNKTTAGHCLVAVIVTQASTASGSPSGLTLGGSADHWTFGCGSTSGTDPSVSIYYDYNCAGGQTSVVISLTGGSGSGGTAAWVFEVPGAFTSPPLFDANTAFINTSNTTFSVSGPFPGYSQEVAFCVVATPTGIIPTGPGYPWAEAGQLSVASSFNAICGYQVNGDAIAPFNYAGTISPAGISNVALLSLKLTSPGTSIGTAQAQIGPVNQREVWAPESIAVSVSTQNSQSACNIYTGTDTTQPNFIDSTTTGSSGFTTYPTSNRLVRPGEYVFAVWSGADAGSQASVNIQGTKQIGSGGPPQWQHVRTRR